MERKLMANLYDWKISKHRKPLVLWGARQTGKTWLMREFGKRYFDSVVYISFYNNKKISQIFETDYDIKRIINALEIELHVNIVPGVTLLIFDEVQYAPKVLESLKYFCEDAADYAVVCAGSLLGVALHEGVSFPVGKVDELHLYPMSFEEFLCANGEERLADYCKDYHMPEVTDFSERYVKLLKAYYIVGGMPEVVYSFYEHRDFAKVMKLQQNILVKYRAKIAKSNTERRAGLINKCYNSIPKQLNSELKKFKYSRVEKGQTKRKYGTSVDWLLEAGYVIPSYNAINASVPLEESCNKSQFKLYLNDVGLLTCIYGFDTKRHVLNNVVKGNVRTAIYENAVAQSLVACGYNIYYHKPDDNHEVEFIIEKDNEAIPIEAKAGSRVSVSMSNYITKFKPGTAYKLTEEIGQQSEDTQIMPYYGVVFALS